ncbi:MAG: hypothetical protein JXA22_08600 [Candidatus Thermoplasmatota archaeon]|nr:hypothetical protein [Candidatus Thermoplasmatota archaeon]
MGDEKITGQKSPVGTLFLNLCLLGCVGYFYIGQWQKGLAALAATLILSGIGVGLIVPIVACIDGYMQAKLMTEGKALKHWTFFSQSA